MFKFFPRHHFDRPLLGVTKILGLGNPKYWQIKFGKHFLSQSRVPGGHFKPYLKSLDPVVWILQAFINFSLHHFYGPYLGLTKILRLGNPLYWQKNFGKHFLSLRTVPGGHFKPYLKSLDPVVWILQAFKFFLAPFWPAVLGRNQNFKTREPHILTEKFWETFFIIK